MGHARFLFAKTASDELKALPNQLKAIRSFFHHQTVNGAALFFGFKF